MGQLHREMPEVGFCMRRAAAANEDAEVKEAPPGNHGYLD